MQILVTSVIGCSWEHGRHVQLRYHLTQKKKSNSSGYVKSHSKNSDSGKKTSSNNLIHSTNPNTQTCLACNGKSHDIYECPKFLGMSLNDKWESKTRNSAVSVWDNIMFYVVSQNYYVVNLDVRLNTIDCYIITEKLLQSQNQLKIRRTITALINRLTSWYYEDTSQWPYTGRLTSSHFWTKDPILNSSKTGSFKNLELLEYQQIYS